MRILLVNHEFTITGASLALLHLSEHLEAVGHQLVVFPCNPEPGPIRDAYAGRGIPIADTVRTGDFDIALCNTICAVDVLVALAPHLKTVWLILETDIGLRILFEKPSRVARVAQATAGV